jgi:hypothetical protein
MVGIDGRVFVLEPESYQPVFRRIYCLTIVIPGSKKVGTNRASDFLIGKSGPLQKARGGSHLT